MVVWEETKLDELARDRGKGRQGKVLFGNCSPLMSASVATRSSDLTAPGSAIFETGS